MRVKPKLEAKRAKAIRIPDAPIWLHKKIKHYMAEMLRTEKRELTKPLACIELLDHATKDINL